MASAKAGAKGSADKKGKARSKAAKKRPKCIEKTKAGERCTNYAKHGSKHCGSHGPNAGRKHGFTKQIGEAILIWLEQGAYAKVAAQAVGINESTFYAWLNEGQADVDAGKDTDLAEFSKTYREAQSKGELALIADARNAGRKDGRLALEILSRRHPDRWSKRKRVEHSGPGGGPIETRKSTFDPSKLTPDQLKQLIELHKAGTSTDPPTGGPS